VARASNSLSSFSIWMKQNSAHLYSNNLFLYIAMYMIKNFDGHQCAVSYYKVSIENH